MTEGRCQASVPRIVAVLIALLVAGCTPYPTNLVRTPSHAFDQPLRTPLGQTYAPLATGPGQSAFHLLVSGPEAFAARASLAETAQKTLDLQYYIIAHDASATALMDAALRAARRGVRVRLLVDDLNVGDHELRLASLAEEPNLEVRLFNPFAERGQLGFSQLLEWLTDTDRLNRRMHNKLWIADGAVAVMGGRNLGDAYFNLSTEGDFADLDVLAAGPVVSDMGRSFDRYWNSDMAVPIASIAGLPQAAVELQKLWDDMAARTLRFRDSDYVRELRKTAFGGLVRMGGVPMVAAPAQILDQLPADADADALAPTGTIFSQLRRSIENAQRDVVLVSPYLVPAPSGVEVLCGVARRGVPVRILTNSLASTDVPLVHAAYARYRPQLLACGITVHELRPGGATEGAPRLGLSSGASLHSKAVVVDGETVFIGSMNLDPRSRLLNTEVALRIESRELGGQLTRLFDEAIVPDQVFQVALDEPGNAGASLHWDTREKGLPARYTSDPLASPWRRWLVGLLGALAPEALL
ncbi:phospholipase D family protein [Hydrogenophaga sp. BPS33]|uniref:phospholipase D family protein n=1 Tax=Hydrogenophaga sp. BPS33 TaxID=2651974 RepID=UPI00135946F6|nr:phospholipase D family protein [Hydrogenophaga sp. BPS33]